MTAAARCRPLFQTPFDGTVVAFFGSFIVIVGCSPLSLTARFRLLPSVLSTPVLLSLMALETQLIFSRFSFPCLFPCAFSFPCLFEHAGNFKGSQAI